MLFQTMDILLLAHFWGTTEVGVYAVAKTLAHVSLYLPTGVATFLMPKAAGAPAHAHRWMLERALILSMAVCLATLALYLLFGKWIVIMLFGPEYVIGTNVMIMLALGMIMLSIHSVVTAVLVGGGRPGLETISRVVALCCSALVGWIMVPIYGVFGAATVIFIGPLTALITYVVFIFPRKGEVNLS